MSVLADVDIPIFISPLSKSSHKDHDVIKHNIGIFYDAASINLIIFCSYLLYYAKPKHYDANEIEHIVNY